MTNEERQKQMDFILEQQAKFSIGIERLEESHRAAEKRMSALEKGFVNLYNFLDETAKLTRENAAQIASLREAQKETNMRLDTTNERLDATNERLNAFIVVLEEDISSRRNGREKKRRASTKSRASSKKRKS